MALTHGRNWTAELARAVGLDPGKVSAFELRAAIDDVVTVKVWQYADIDNMDHVIEMVAELDWSPRSRDA